VIDRGPLESIRGECQAHDRKAEPANMTPHDKEFPRRVRARKLPTRCADLCHRSRRRRTLGILSYMPNGDGGRHVRDEIHAAVFSRLERNPIPPVFFSAFIERLSGGLQ